MKKFIFSLAIILIAGTASMWADSTSTEAEYNTALTTVTDGTYYVYALSGTTKYYLKAEATNASKSKEIDFASFTTDKNEATLFNVEQVEVTSGEVAKSWKFTCSTATASYPYHFTNPSMKNGSINNTGFLRGNSRNNNKNWTYDTQVLYSDGSAFAVRATNATAGQWGEAAFWNIIETNPGYTDAAAYVWHFEKPVVTSISSGKYTIIGANASWAGKGSAPYWINNNSNISCLWNDASQAATYDVIVGDGCYYLYDATGNKYMSFSSSDGNIWYTSPNSVMPLYVASQTYNSDTYFTLSRLQGAVLGTDAEFCTANEAGSSLSIRDGYGYTAIVKNTYMCSSTNGYDNSALNPDALWKFNLQGESTATVFDISKLQHGTPGLAAALKNNDKGSVKYELTVTDAGWATICLPFAADVPTGTTVYSLSEQADGTVKASTVSAIEAGKAYLVKADAGTYDFAASVSAIDATDAPATGNTLTGLYEQGKVPAGSYVLQKQDDEVGFYKAESDISTDAFHGYITLSVTGSAKAGNKIALNIDNSTTAIKKVSKNNGYASHSLNQVYNLAGQRVNANTKGILIINGKKVLK